MAVMEMMVLVLQVGLCVVTAGCEVRRGQMGSALRYGSA